MKKIVCLLMLFISIESFAREMLFDESESQKITKTGLCDNYNKTAMESIYTWYESVDQQLLGDVYARRDCDIKYKKQMENNDHEMTIAEQKYFFQMYCDSDKILSTEKINSLSAQRSSSAYKYVASFKTRAQFTSAHMTNFRMTCEKAKENIDKLKELLNL